MFTVVAGTGYTGRRILSLLPTDSVVGLSRSSIDTDREIHRFDLDTATALPLELAGHYGVIYTVPPAGDPPDARLQRFLPLLSARRFVYISTTGVYGDYGGATVTESSELHPSNSRSARRVAAEALLEEWARQQGTALVIIRAPGIYGPGRLGVERIRQGLPVLAEQDANPGNRIHVEDLARCCVAAMSEDVPPGVFNVGDGDHRSSTAFSNEVARQLELPTPPQISLAEAREQFSPERMAFLSDSRVVDTRRMREILDVMPLYADPAEGIRASLTGD